MTKMILTEEIKNGLFTKKGIDLCLHFRKYLHLNTQSINQKTIRRVNIPFDICGWGISDADYRTGIIFGKKTIKCPSYDRWIGIIGRSYSKRWQKRIPLIVE